MAAKYLPKVSRRGGSGGQDEVAIIQAEIEELEYQRETSSLGLAAERDIVRKIAALKKQQTQFVDFTALKSERKRLNDELDALFARRSELRDALRTNAMTERIRALNPGVSVAVSDITHAMLQLPQSVVGRVVGKAGASRVQIEKDCGVLIDVNDGADGSGVVNFKITGIPSGIEAATTRIEELTSQEEETLEINGGLANLLLTRSGAGIRQLEADTGARVQLSRHEHRVTLVGAPRCVSEAKSWLATVQDSRVIMTVPPAVLPAVIGKGGSNFRRIQETHGVEIDLQKPVAGEPVGAGFTLTVWGIEPAALESARGELLHLISSNTKHAVAVEIDPAMVPFLVASAAERVKAFQKAHDVSMSVKRSGASRGTPSIEGIVVPPGATAWVEFSGVRAALDAATTAFALDIAEFDRTCIRVRLTAAQARALIGKSGEGAKKLRADTGVSIDVEVGGASGGPGADARRHQQLYDLLPNEAVVIMRSGE